MLPCLNAKVASLLDIALVYDPVKRATARELYSLVRSTMRDDAKEAPRTAAATTEEADSVVVDLINFFNKELTAKDAQLSAMEISMGEQHKQLAAELAAKDEQLAELTRRIKAGRCRSACRPDTGPDEARVTSPYITSRSLPAIKPASSS